MPQSFEEYVLDQRGRGNPFVDQLAAVYEQYQGAQEQQTHPAEPAPEPTEPAPTGDPNTPGSNTPDNQ